MAATFTPGTLCCANDGGTLVYTGAAWERVPHNTEWSFTEEVTESAAITSDTAGRESTACGTVNTTGTLGLACHDGTKMVLGINMLYQVRFADVLNDIWNVTTDTLVATPDAETYYEGTVLITSKPKTVQINGTEISIITYAWKLDGEWTNEPTVTPIT